MRVGIVTQPLEMNYGGILQNWALQQVLKRLGHDPITIDAYQRFSTPHFVFNYVRARFMLMLGREYYLPRRYKGAMRSKRTGEFIEDHIVKTKVMWDYKPSVIKKYRLEALVVGSDVLCVRIPCQESGLCCLVRGRQMGIHSRTDGCLCAVGPAV